MRWPNVIAPALVLVLMGAVRADQGVEVHYRLPADGPLPATYRVTLAATHPDDPDRIVSTFLAGAVRTVTAENQGRFTEVWDGLDDNFMPVPPGTYGLKGIYMPARKWKMTDEYHTIIPRYVFGSCDSWAPTAEQDEKVPWRHHHMFGPPMAVDAAPDGHAAFYFQYHENSTNPYLLDLNKPIGYDQVLQRYTSWAAAGGWAVATDGELVWGACCNGGIPMIYRADMKPFGTDNGRWRRNLYSPKALTPDICAWRDPQTGQRFLYVIQMNKDFPEMYRWLEWYGSNQYAVGQRGKMFRDASGRADNPEPQKDSCLIVLNGDNAQELARVPIRHPLSVTALDGKHAYVMHMDAQDHWGISRIAVKDGLPQGEWERLFDIPQEIADPADMARDSRGNFYVSDPNANQVYSLDAQGKVSRRFGRAAEQKPGAYDENIFMWPQSLATWTDKEGGDRLLVVERGGPYRISEWSPDGKLLRQWFFLTPNMHGGFALDPQNTEDLYVTTGGGAGVVRVKLDFATRSWKIDAVWPHLTQNMRQPRIIHHGGRMYLAVRGGSGGNNYMLYRDEGGNLLPSGGLVTGADGKFYLWHDANGNGQVDKEEYADRPANIPATPYWGNDWLDDLSMAVFQDQFVWRLAPGGFDAHGNPIFDGTKWTKLLTDPFLAANAAGTAGPLDGGNEVSKSYAYGWTSLDGTIEDGFFVNAYVGGRSPLIDGGLRPAGTAARESPEVKLSRYVPDGQGGYRMLWRVGRKAFHRAVPGEVYSSMLIERPLYGIFGVHDGNGLYHLYTDDGLFVDMLMIDGIRGARPGYVRGPGNELVAGGVYVHCGEGEYWTRPFHFQRDGKVLLAMGRGHVHIYELEGWTKDDNSIRRIRDVDKQVTLTADCIAPPRDEAKRLRGLK